MMDKKVSCSRILKLMGNRFEFTVISHDRRSAEKAIDAAVSEVQRIERLLSTFQESSETNLINRNAGIRPVVVGSEILQLIQRSKKISGLTQGAFDITYGSIDASLWNFDVHMTSLPNAETALKSVDLINYNNIILDIANSTVLLKNKGMRIGFGGIGKGYAADRAKQVLVEADVGSGIVNAAGDLTTWGTQLNGQPWTIGIADPDQRTQSFSALNISDMAIATSDNWGIRAHTAELEVPVKISSFFSLSPFYRYNNQTGTRYFAAYGEHNPNAKYYTSDYDLSTLNSDFYGAGIRFSPPKGVFGWQHLNMLELRYGHYTRSTALNSNIITLNLKFK